MERAALNSSIDEAVIFTKNSVCIHAPVEIITKPVIVHIINVSIYGPSIATAPSRTECFVFAVECAMAADPCPASLEYKPLFEFPPKPIALLKWLFNYPDGFIFPWAAIHFTIAFLCYYFLVPSFDILSSFSLSWSSIIFFKNFILLLIYTGLWHWYLHFKNFQGDKF